MIPFLKSFRQKLSNLSHFTIEMEENLTPNHSLLLIYVPLTSYSPSESFSESFA